VVQLGINVIQHDDRFYDIYDRFTMERFPLRQNIILTTSFFLLATVHNTTFEFHSHLLLILRIDTSETISPKVIEYK
jgi:hypothetical protein